VNWHRPRSFMVRGGASQFCPFHLCGTSAINLGFCATGRGERGQARFRPTLSHFVLPTWHASPFKPLSTFSKQQSSAVCCPLLPRHAGAKKREKRCEKLPSKVSRARATGVMLSAAFKSSARWNRRSGCSLNRSMNFHPISLIFIGCVCVWLLSFAVWSVAIIV
jgi:hypothetical protein